MTHVPPPASLVRRHGSVAAARTARRRIARRVGPLLRDFVAQHDPAAHVPRDPVQFPRRWSDPADQEVVGLVASALAYGKVESILRSVDRVLGVLGPEPARAARTLDPGRLAMALGDFRHRWTRGEDVAALVWAAGRVQARDGSLGRGLVERLGAGTSLREALGAWVQDLRSQDFSPLTGQAAPPPGLGFLLPDPARGSAAKRLLLYLRWMARGPDRVDVGAWGIPTASLLVPLDTHTARISRLLGLTERADASWTTAEEVTWHLSALDPADPVRFDFALCHLGISGACPSRRDPIRCAGCALLPACRA